MSGENIELVCGNVSFIVVVERVMSERTIRTSEGTQTLSVRIALPHRPYGRLHVRDYLNGVVDFNGISEERTAVWVVTHPTSRITRFESTVKRQQKSREKGSPDIRFQLAVQGGDHLVADRIILRNGDGDGDDDADSTERSTAAASEDNTLWSVRAVNTTYNADLDVSTGINMTINKRIGRLEEPTAAVHHISSNSSNSDNGTSSCNSGSIDIKVAALSTLKAAVASASLIIPLPTRTPAVPAKSLTEKDLLSFVHNGFTVVRQLLPLDVLHAAKIAVNARLGRPGGMTDFYGPDDKPALRPPSGFTETAQILEHVRGSEVGRVAPDASHDPMLLACGNCPEVWRIMSQLMGQGKVAPLAGVQVALRFPRSLDALVVSGAAMESRVHGTSWHTDGLRQGKKHSFSLLVGIALSDEMVAPDNGNLCVWPRSHLHIHHWMRHPDGMIPRAASPHGGCLDSDGPLPDLGAPVQLLLRAGDVVFVHSEVGHCGGPHLGPDIRTMLYFRVRHVDWKQMCENGTLVDNMWCDLEGVQHIRDAKLLEKGCTHLPAMDECREVCTLFDSDHPTAEAAGGAGAVFSGHRCC